LPLSMYNTSVPRLFHFSRSDCAQFHEPVHLRIAVIPAAYPACAVYNAAMELHPVSPDVYLALLPLAPEEPGTLLANAILRSPHAKITVAADDLTHPTAFVIEQQVGQAGQTEGHSVTFIGAMDEATLTAYLRQLEPPAMLYVPAALAARLYALDIMHANLVTCAYVTFAPPTDTGLNSVFLASPPGGMRRLRAADAHHLTIIPAAFWGAYGTAASALSEGIVYARYLRAEIVSLACVTARTERYAEIGTFTIERARGNDFARDCVARLIGAVVAEWAVLPMLTGAANDEETRSIAHALGLTEEHAWTAYVLTRTGTGTPA